ncbi:unnamed protein product [Caenorhabditis nigoni]
MYIYAVVRHIKMYLKSFHFQTRNKFPQLPFWLKLGNLQRYREFEHPKFQIYQKHYAKKTWVNSTGQVKEKEKLVILMMRKVLTDVFGITVDARTLPDSTCVISIPMRNFKCSTARPEVFISKNDEVSMTRIFEYQMIGDDRIQVTYYKVKGIEYVAGVCIYIENPYQSIIHYRESIIKKLLNGIEYWSTVNVREESMAIKMMSDNQILMTRSVYGEIKYWKHLGDQKKFQQIEMVNAEMIRPEVQSETFSIIIILRYIQLYFKSKQFKKRTSTPRVPHWLEGNLCGPNLKIWDFTAIPPWRIYTKDYCIQTTNNRGGETEKDKDIVKKMRKLLGELYDITCDYELFPPSTCIVSCPRKNFRCGLMPGMFVPIHGGPPDSHFEFQMIGDNRIQVAYYVAGGVYKYEYNATVIRNLMVQGPDYWSNWNLKEEKMDVVERKEIDRFELVTRNRYGVETNWKLIEDRKRFDPIGKSRNPEFEYMEEGDPRSHIPLLTVRMCHTNKEIVMIEKNRGKMRHASWDSAARAMEFSDCATCEQIKDDPPPTYASSFVGI